MRGVPVRRVDGHLVTTVLDLMLAQYGVGRADLPGEWPSGYDDASTPYTPAWQEEITGVPAEAVTRIAREFAQNAAESKGRSMIIVGAGTNHWFHSDTIYRCMLMLTTITGCQGVNGGGWAHYVGQEKARPITGWAQLAFGLDWVRPPRQMIQTGYWYLHTDQFRYDNYGVEHLAASTADGQARRDGHRRRARPVRAAGLDAVVPDLRPQPARPRRRRPRPRASRSSDYVVDQLKSGELSFAVRGPGRAGELAPDADDVAGQPVRLQRQGQRVLPQAPARHRLLDAGRGDARRGSVRATSCGTTRRPRGSSTCCARSTSG